MIEWIKKAQKKMAFYSGSRLISGGGVKIKG